MSRPLSMQSWIGCWQAGALRTTRHGYKQMVAWMGAFWIAPACRY